jgi:Arc/MetJ-type ribon-helix-helix transcriptional regulator
MIDRRTKISVTIPETVVSAVDTLVKQGNFPNRSAAFEEAVKKLLRSHLDAHIEAEAAKLDRDIEKAEAEEGMADYSRLVGE